VLHLPRPKESLNTILGDVVSIDKSKPKRCTIGTRRVYPAHTSPGNPENKAMIVQRFVVEGKLKAPSQRLQFFVDNIVLACRAS
jgi:hypothetical protein